MTTLVFGSKGMLGAALMRNLKDVYGAADVDITKAAEVERVLDWVQPDSVVNCAGIVKSECRDEKRVWAVNAEAPHALASAARRRQARFIHISTDCVFNGRRGGYVESDSTDAEDLYGKSKAAGEVVRPNCLTIRTSFIGRDARNRRGLLEWLLAQEDFAPGLVNAMWSGLSAPELARVIASALGSSIDGLYHVAGPVISKADLLEVLSRTFDLGCRIDRVPSDPIDRTLNGSKFAKATGYEPPSWVEMARELA